MFELDPLDDDIDEWAQRLGPTKLPEPTVQDLEKVKERYAGTEDAWPGTRRGTSTSPVVRRV